MFFWKASWGAAKSLCSENSTLGIPCVYSREGPSINFRGPGKRLFPGSSPAGYDDGPKSIRLRCFFVSSDLHSYPRDPDKRKTVCIVNLLSVVNLLRVVMHY